MIGKDVEFYTEDFKTKKGKIVGEFLYYKLQKIDLPSGQGGRITCNSIAQSTFYFIEIENELHRICANNIKAIIQ